MDGWNTILSFGVSAYFQGRTVVSGRVADQKIENGKFDKKTSTGKISSRSLCIPFDQCMVIFIYKWLKCMGKCR